MPKPTTRRAVCATLLTLLIAAPALAAPPASPPKPKPLPPGVALIRVDDLHCKTCARKLASKLYAVPGVVRVRADLKKDTATITLQKKKTVAPAVLWDAAIASGQAPVELRIADKRLVAKDFPKAKKVATTPHASPAKQ